MKLKDKSWFKKVIVALLVMIVVALCLFAYFYFTQVHKNKICRTLDHLTREQIESISVVSQNGGVALLEKEDEVESVLSLITQIDAYGSGSEEWRNLNGGQIPLAFYIELKNGTDFYVGTDGIVDSLMYKVHSDWMLNHKLFQLYWALYNRYSVPWTEVRMRVSLELVEETLEDTSATFIIHNDSYYDIYIDGEFKLGPVNSSPGQYTVDIENAHKIEHRSQYEITLEWSEQDKDISDGNYGVFLYYTTEQAHFGAYVGCELKK